MLDFDWQGHVQYIRDLAGNPSYKDAFTYLGAFIAYVALYSLGAIGGKAAWASVRGPLKIGWAVSRFCGLGMWDLGKLAAKPAQLGWRSWQLRRRLAKRVAEEQHKQQMRELVGELVTASLDEATRPASCPKSKPARQLDGGLERGRDYLGSQFVTG